MSKLTKFKKKIKKNKGISKDIRSKKQENKTHNSNVAYWCQVVIFQFFFPNLKNKIEKFNQLIVDNFCFF